MNETIIVAIISLAGTLMGTLGGILVSNKLTIYRIEQLEKKVENHNSVTERTYNLEEKIAVLETKEKVTEHRVSDLEKKMQEFS